MTKAEDHVDWQLKILRPLLVSYFNHGYKHGIEDAETPQDEQNVTVSARTDESPYLDYRDSRISTTEDIQRGWAKNEKTRVYEDGR
jgi:hypothetical protein